MLPQEGKVGADGTKITAGSLFFWCDRPRNPRNLNRKLAKYPALCPWFIVRPCTALTFKTRKGCNSGDDLQGLYGYQWAILQATTYFVLFLHIGSRQALTKLSVGIYHTNLPSCWLMRSSALLLWCIGVRSKLPSQYYLHNTARKASVKTRFTGQLSKYCRPSSAPDILGRRHVGECQRPHQGSER